jgi:hypothetical protein
VERAAADSHPNRGGRSISPRTNGGLFVAISGGVVMSLVIAWASAPISVPTVADVHAPTSYRATEDRALRPKPPLPALGPSGSHIIDPTFGSRILRVTDELTRPDQRQRSFYSASSAEQNSWNVNSTLFYVLGSGGESIPFRFDPIKMTASRLGNLILPFGGEPAFSITDPNIIYGIGGRLGRTILRYSFLTGATTALMDLDSMVARPSGYTGSVSVSANERLATYFGGLAQDSHFYVVVYDLSTGSSTLLNTRTGTINGVQNRDIAWNWFIHNARLDKSGRYVVITPAGGAPVGLVVWDIVTGHAAQVSPAGGGHKVSGYGVLINNDVLPGHTWDGMQWLRRSLDLPNLGTATELISPTLSPSGGGGDSHLSWNHARPDTLVPVVISTYRLPTDTAPWRAWDNEIIAVRTDGGVSTVWRFAHHRSRVEGFWDMPRGNVSQDGRWFLFTSNWEGTLGMDETGSNLRDDAFVLELTAP